MPDSERRGQQAVALPMADILAEARQPSPWDGLSGQADFDHILAQTIDELSPLDRVMACQRIDEATDQERRLLMAMAYYGYTSWVSYEALSRDTGIRADLIGRHAGKLEKKGILRITIAHLPNGRRLRLFTLSGRFLMVAYRRWRGEGAALDKSSSADGGGASSALDFSASALDFSDSARSSALDFSGPHSTFRSPITLVSRYTDIQSVSEERLTNVPGGEKVEKPPALDDLSSAPPSWWRRFMVCLASVPEPRPRLPAWEEVSGLVSPAEDPGALMFREACARFLDTYSQPGHARVRNVRSVIRRIYLTVLAGGPQEHSARRWFGEGI